MALVLLLALSLSTPVIGVNVTIGLLTSDESENLASLQMAVTDVNKNMTVLPNVNLQLEVSQLPDSSDYRQLIRIIKKIMDSGVVTTFTPESLCEFGPLFANVNRNKITISHECSGRHLSDKLQYPLLVRTHPSESIAAHSILSFLSHTKWDRITVVVQNQRKWTSLSNLVLSWAHRYKVKIDYTCFVDDEWTASLENEPYSRHSAHKTILRTLYKTRVYVFLGDVTLLRDFVFILSEITDHQRLAVVSFDKDGFTPNSFYVPKPEQESQGLLQVPDDRMEPKSLVPEKIPSTIPGLFVVSRAMPDHEAFANFSNRLRTLTNTEDEDRHATQLVRAEYIYDAVSIYARALDWILRSQHIESEDQIARLAANGTALFTAITSMQNFTSVTGDIISFDGNGDRLVRYIVAASRNWIEETHSATVSAEPMVIVGSFQTDAHLTTFQPSAKIRPPEEIKMPYAKVQLFPEERINLFVAVCSLVVVVTASFARAILRRLILYLDGDIDSKSANESNNELNLPPTMVAVNDSSKTHTVSRNDWRTKVYIRTLHMFPKRRELEELSRLRHMDHPNINRLMATSVRVDRIVLVSQFCANGSLWDLLGNKNRRLADERFVSSLMLDLIRGMIYLHQQMQVPEPKRVHGNLKSTNCLVDSYWNLKLTDFGLQRWHSHVNDDEDAHYFRRLWWAPELLRDEEKGRLGTREGDIYAFGVIIHEILGKQGPFGIRSSQSSLKDVIERVKRGPTGRLARYRPPWHCITERWNGRMNPHLCWCMKECWREDPSRRPKSFVRILEGLQDQLKHGIESVIQIARASDRSPGIKALIEKERQIRRQREQKLEKLLSFIRPLQTSPVMPRPLGQVSVLVVDIVRFTAITSTLTPLQTLFMLDDVYSLFDQVCRNYGICKVGTVGDAYIATGINYPVHRSVFEINGDLTAWNQAVQIAKMAREFLARIKTLNIPEIGHALSVRIGIHKGPAVFGLSGWYWIFGHCLPVAFNLQSTGRDSCIQLSRPIYEELDQSGLYQGELHSVKCNHTDQEYYWLRPATNQLDYGNLLDPHPSKLCYRGSYVSSDTE